MNAIDKTLNDAAATTFLIHPAAADLPMMADAALDDLAADIKKHGQQIPILVDAKDVLFDGRNRLEACRRAGVQPKVDIIRTPAYPEAFVASLNAKRRDLTPSTRALAAARAWKRAVDDGRVLKPGETARRPSSGKLPKDDLIADPRGHFASLYDANEKYAQQAYALVARDPAGVEAVERGDSVKDAYEKLIEREAESNAENAKRARLEAHAPDLLELVNDGRMTLGEALAALNERQHREEQIRAGGRRAAADLKLAFANIVSVEQAMDLGEHDLVDDESLARLIVSAERLRTRINGEGEEQGGGDEARERQTV